MDKLPLEIQRLVFMHVDLQQRLVCLRVCQSWWRLLDSYSLFYDIDLCGDSEEVQVLYAAHRGEHTYIAQFNKIINMFERFPARAAQVQEVYVKPHPNLRNLLNTFPNARVIHVASDWRLNHQVGKHIDITHSKSKMEFLADNHHCELASQLLYSNLGGRLKTLCLDFNSLSNAPTVISQLKNLPSLEKLSLCGPKLNFETLENIHKDIPSVRDFTLKYIRIEPDSLPLDIIPATHITKFTYDRCRFDNSDIHTTFYHYMAVKYSNATNIEYEDDMLRHYAPDIARRIYLLGVLDLFRAITPNRGKLALTSLPGDIDPFESLDIGDSKVQNLDLLFCQNKITLQHFSQSNQFKHVKELTFHNSNIDSIRLVKDMPALATLRVRFSSLKSPSVHLLDCLSACPTSLRTLSIECFDMVIDPFENHLDSIENLDIDVTTITSGLGDIISSCFPSLVNLKLRGMVEENVNITLNNPHFHKVTFVTIPYLRGKYSNHGFSFKSPHHKRVQYCYCYEREIMRVPYKEIKGLPMLLVTSLSGKTLDVHGDSLKILS